MDYIIHTGMPVVTTRGKGFEDQLVNQIEAATGLPRPPAFAPPSVRSRISASVRRRADALSAGAAPIGTDLPRDERLDIAGEHTMDVVFKRLQDVTPAQILATPERVVAAAPSADGVYIPCDQWSGGTPRR